MKRDFWLASLIMILLLVSACSIRVIAPVPDRIEEETDENGNVIGILSTYEEDNKKEEVYKEKDENGNWVEKWILLTLFDEEKDPIEERLTHQGLLSFVKRYFYENLSSSRDRKDVSKVEYSSDGNTIQHMEEYTYDLTGRLTRIDHYDIVTTGEEVYKWHTAFTYEGEQREPNEERIFAEGHFNENTGDETVEFCTYIYNEARLITEKRTAGDGLNDRVLLFEYNDQSLLVSEEYQKEGQTISTKTYLYEGEILRSIEIRDGTGKLVKKRTID